MFPRVAARIASLSALCLVLSVLAGGPARAQPALPQLAPCPREIPADTNCYAGRDTAGAYYWIAIPANWNRVLVVHAHGGPDLGPPTPRRSHADLARWSVLVKAGYAWAGSSYRRGGYGVTMAAEDVERLRRLFLREFGQPRRTLLHGQSYGASVAAKAAELFGGVEGKTAPYDGVVLTSGLLGGAPAAYAFRLDLRVVYQYVCRNHPRPDEPQYPLWMGLLPDSPLTHAELAARIRSCTGIGLPPAQRSAEQSARLRTILSVVKIPERTFVSHMNWATWMFRDITQERLQGRNPFDNHAAVYADSSDDAALNAGVARYRADPLALGQLLADSRPTGRIPVPVLTLHAIHDPTAPVELESLYRAIVHHAGHGDRLVQVYTDEAEHSYLSAPEYPALFAALLDWADKGEKPTPALVAALCKRYEKEYGDGGREACHVAPGYKPPPLGTRVPAR
ncbi:o-phthalyl amidase [Pigmentiphaga humi]|uniref:O-phthalyl amidase n=1 Tax=Pigmentiphaga humi TaxID=2478468 RepID=A0A3P4B0G3_9BURK|nr:hypothetical protein [Pigmentiphaga humi]VCU69787.1 o-phthalyl amidase [Pigmentiphaga humi]